MKHLVYAVGGGVQIHTATLAHPLPPPQALQESEETKLKRRL